MTRKELINLLNETGSENDEIFIRGNNSFIIPITDAITMDKDEICLINGEVEISPEKALADLKDNSFNIKQIEKKASDFVFNHTIYMQDEHSKLTEKDLSNMETDIVCALLRELGYEHQSGMWEKK